MFSLQWNLAGLTFLEYTSVEFNHIQYFADTRYEYLAVGLPNKGWGALGFGLSYSGVSDLFMIDETGFSEKAKAYDIDEIKASSFNVVWDGVIASGDVVPSGIYIVAIETDSFTETRKIIVMK